MARELGLALFSLEADGIFQQSRLSGILINSYGESACPALF
jgi:hypothetical protein